MNHHDPFFPLFLRLQDRRVLVVGGDKIALQKIAGLHTAQANILIVAKKLIPPLFDRVMREKMTWIADTFQPHHLTDVWYAVATSNDDDELKRLFDAANQARVWLNVVDRPEWCTAIAPAIVHRDPVTVAISTSGKAPAFASWLQKKIAHLLPAGLEEAILWIDAQRPLVAKQLPNLADRGALWRRLLDHGLLNLLILQQTEKAEQWLNKELQR